MSLVRKELIRPEGAVLPGEEAFRFRHALIRDAAYEGVPKGEEPSCTSATPTGSSEVLASGRTPRGSSATTSSKPTGTGGARLIDERRSNSPDSQHEDSFRRPARLPPRRHPAAINLLERARSLPVRRMSARGSSSHPTSASRCSRRANSSAPAKSSMMRSIRPRSSTIIMRSATPGSCATTPACSTSPTRSSSRADASHAEESIELFQEAGEQRRSAGRGTSSGTSTSARRGAPDSEMAERSLAHAKRAGSSIDEAWSLACSLLPPRRPDARR